MSDLLVTLDRLNTSLVALRRELKPIREQPCRLVEFTYGQELLVHFGEPLPNGTRLKGRSRWLLTTRATPWFAKIGRQVIASTTRSKSKLDRLHALEGRVVRRFSPSPDFGLMVTFDRGAAIRLIPNVTDRPGRNPLPYWELFMPDHSVLAVGPGRQWHLTRSDVPHSTALLPETALAQAAAAERSRLAATDWRTVANLRDLIDELMDEAKRLERLMARTRDRSTRSRLKYLEAKWKRLRDAL